MDVVAGSHGDAAAIAAADAAAGRRRKTAAERRAQRARAQARAVSHLLAGFDEVAAHRGNAVSRTASIFSRALRCLKSGGWALYEKDGAGAGGEGPTTAPPSMSTSFTDAAERGARAGRRGIVCKEANSGPASSYAAYGSFVVSGVEGASEGVSTPSSAPAVVDAQKLVEVIQVPMMTRCSGNDDMASVPVVGLLGGFQNVDSMAAETSASSTSAAAASSSTPSKRVSFKDEGWLVGKHVSLDGEAEEASKVAPSRSSASCSVSTKAIVSVQEVDKDVLGGKAEEKASRVVPSRSSASSSVSTSTVVSAQEASSCAVSAVSTSAAEAAASSSSSARRPARRKNVKGQSSEQAIACSPMAKVGDKAAASKTSASSSAARVSVEVDGVGEAGEGVSVPSSATTVLSFSGLFDDFPPSRAFVEAGGRVASIQRAVQEAKVSGKVFPFGMKGADYDEEAGDRDEFPFGLKGVDYDRVPGDREG
jgi:hypothetical protein